MPENRVLWKDHCITRDTGEACGPSGNYDATVGGDCDDNFADIYPGAPETCDGRDTDCDGLADADDPDETGSSPQVRVEPGIFPADSHDSGLGLGLGFLGNLASPDGSA